VWLAGIPGARETRLTPSKETCRLRNCLFISGLYIKQMKSPLEATIFSSPGLEAAAGHLGGLSGDVAEELLDGGDQGLFFL
jgi:hypothetical protein